MPPRTSRPNVTIECTYVPDKERMVKALLFLLERAMKQELPPTT